MSTQQRDGWAMEVRTRETVRIEVPIGNGQVERVSITLEHKTGQVARLRIRAAESVTIKSPRGNELPVMS